MRQLFPTIRIALDRAARGARDDDPAPSHPDPGAHGRQQKREALLAERPLEGGWHPDVVAHPDPTRELHVPSRSAGMALERLAFGQAEERRHALQGDPPLHAAVPSLRHRNKDRSRT